MSALLSAYKEAVLRYEALSAAVTVRAEAAAAAPRAAPPQPVPVPQPQDPVPLPAISHSQLLPPQPSLPQPLLPPVDDAPPPQPPANQVGRRLGTTTQELSRMHCSCVPSDHRLQRTGLLFGGVEGAAEDGPSSL